MGVTMQRTGDTNLNFHGGYVYVAYWLTNDYSPWKRQRGVLGRTKPNENFFIAQLWLQNFSTFTKLPNSEFTNLLKLQVDE